MAINTGVDISKSVTYIALEPSLGVDITKAVTYIALENPNVTPPIWGTFTLPNGFVGVPYSQSWDMPTSAETVVYTLQSGTLPPGLSISAITGNQARLAGVPTTAGTYTFTIRATNTYGFADQPFTVIISTASSAGGSFISIG
jgi:Putative Ig domain